MQGRKAFDDVNGFRTNEDRLVTDLQGNRVDPRFGTLDNRDNTTDALRKGRQG